MDHLARAALMVRDYGLAPAFWSYHALLVQSSDWTTRARSPVLEAAPEDFATTRSLKHIHPAGLSASAESPSLAGALSPGNWKKRRSRNPAFSVNWTALVLRVFLNSAKAAWERRQTARNGSRCRAGASPSCARSQNVYFSASWIWRLSDRVLVTRPNVPVPRVPPG